MLKHSGSMGFTETGKVGQGSGGRVPLSGALTVPLADAHWRPARLLAQKGSKVLRGQLLAEAGAYVSAPVHSPTSGVIKEVTTCLGVTGTQWPAVIIESDGEDRAADPLPPIADWQEADPELLKKRVAEAGIVGMGGASFPTHVKLAPPPTTYRPDHQWRRMRTLPDRRPSADAREIGEDHQGGTYRGQNTGREKYPYGH